MNIACTRSAGERQRSWKIKQFATFGLNAHVFLRLTADVLPGGPGLFEECLGEGLTGGGLAGPAAPHSAHTVVPPGADHGHVHPFDQRCQRWRSIPHQLPSPGLRGLTEQKQNGTFWKCIFNSV